MNNEQIKSMHAILSSWKAMPFMGLFLFWSRFIVSRSKYSVTKPLYIFKVKIFYCKTKNIAKEVKITSNSLFIMLSLYMYRKLYIGQDKTVHTSTQSCIYLDPKLSIPLSNFVHTPTQIVHTPTQIVSTPVQFVVAKII